MYYNAISKNLTCITTTFYFMCNKINSLVFNQTGRIMSKY